MMISAKPKDELGKEQSVLSQIRVVSNLINLGVNIARFVAFSFVGFATSSKMRSDKAGVFCIKLTSREGVGSTRPALTRATFREAAMGDQNITPSDDLDKSLSFLLDEAKTQEEHYRALLLFWKTRRQNLEALIPNEYSDLWDQINSIFKD